MRGGSVTVRAFLLERYGVMTGESERGDRNDLKRFRLWLGDARWRIGKVRTEEKRSWRWRCVQAMRAEVPVRVMGSRRGVAWRLRLSKNNRLVTPVGLPRSAEH